LSECPECSGMSQCCDYSTINTGDYTIFYTERWMSGSHHHTLPKVALVTTDNLQKLLKEEYDSVFYILKGHHKSI
jgi:hypothetical protein